MTCITTFSLSNTKQIGLVILAALQLKLSFFVVI